MKLNVWKGKGGNKAPLFLSFLLSRSNPFPFISGRTLSNFCSISHPLVIAIAYWLGGFPFFYYTSPAPSRKLGVGGGRVLDNIF